MAAGKAPCKIWNSLTLLIAHSTWILNCAIFLVKITSSAHCWTSKVVAHLNVHLVIPTYLVLRTLSAMILSPGSSYSNKPLNFTSFLSDTEPS